MDITTTELELIVPPGMARLLKDVKIMIVDEHNNLPVLMRNLTQRLMSHLLELDRQMQEIHNQVCELVVPELIRKFNNQAGLQGKG